MSWHICPSILASFVGVRFRRSNVCGPRTSNCGGRRRLEGGVDFLRGRTRPAIETLVAFIYEFKKVFGVKPICRVLSGHGLKSATSTYYVADPAPG